MSEITNAPVENTTEAPATKPSLTLQDLTLMVQILEVGTARGAWKADELSSVGGLYDRVASFLTAAGVELKKNVENSNTEQNKE